MSTKITCSASRTYFNHCNGRGCSYNQSHLPHCGPYNLKPIKCRSRVFSRHNERYGLSRVILISGNIWPKASSSSSNNSSSPSWRKWLLGILLTVILPAAGHKGGLLLGLKGKIDQAIETVEHVTEVAEEIAEEAEKMAEEVEEKLPGDSKIKEALDSFEDLAKVAVKEARKTEDLVHKVKVVEKEVEEALMNAGKDQAKK